MYSLSNLFTLFFSHTDCSSRMLLTADAGMSMPILKQHSTFHTGPRFWKAIKLLQAKTFAIIIHVHVCVPCGKQPCWFCTHNVCGQGQFSCPCTWVLNHGTLQLCWLSCVPVKRHSLVVSQPCSSVTDERVLSMLDKRTCIRWCTACHLSAIDVCTNVRCVSIRIFYSI